MASLILTGGENQFSWRITGLSGAFNQAEYIQAGITMYQFTQGGVTSISGVVDSVSAPYSGSSTSTTTSYVSYDPGTYTFWGFTQVQDGTYWPAGSATVTVYGQTEYIAIVEFDANGGSGAPSSVSGESDTQTVTITLPTREPTWSNHTFVGWALDPDASSAEYSPGGTYPFYGNATGYIHTLYAVWAEDAGGAYLSTGGALNQASVYIYSGGWLKVTPYIYNGGWRKCT